MQYEVSYLPSAEQDLDEIIGFLITKSKAVAGKFLEMLDKAEKQLIDFPLSGLIPKDTRLQVLNYRVIIIENYLVFYVFKDNKYIEIRRILHGVRKYEFLL